MHDHNWELATLYKIRFFDGETQELNFKQAAKHCVEQGLTALIFLGEVEVGWIDCAGNYGVRA